MKRLNTTAFVMLTVFMISAIEACKVTISNNTDQTYQLREVPDGKPKTVEPGQKVSFGSKKHMAHFIVAEQTESGWHDINDVEQTTCGGDKSEKKISIKGILKSKLNGHADKFKITKL